MSMISPFPSDSSELSTIWRTRRGVFGLQATCFSLDYFSTKGTRYASQSHFAFPTGGDFLRSNELPRLNIRLKVTYASSSSELEIMMTSTSSVGAVTRCKGAAEGLVACQHS